MGSSRSAFPFSNSHGICSIGRASLPTLVFNGGPMLYSYLDGELTRAGTIIWVARRRFATGEIDGRKFTELLRVSRRAPGTAT